MLASPKLDAEVALDAGDGGKIWPAVAVEEIVDGLLGDLGLRCGLPGAEAAELTDVAEHPRDVLRELGFGWGVPLEVTVGPGATGEVAARVGLQVKTSGHCVSR